MAHWGRRLRPTIYTTPPPSVSVTRFSKVDVLFSPVESTAADQQINDSCSPGKNAGGTEALLRLFKSSPLWTSPVVCRFVEAHCARGCSPLPASCDFTLRDETRTTAGSMTRFDFIYFFFTKSPPSPLARRPPKRTTTEQIQSNKSRQVAEEFRGGDGVFFFSILRTKIYPKKDVDVSFQRGHKRLRAEAAGNLPQVLPPFFSKTKASFAAALSALLRRSLSCEGVFFS